MYFSTWDLLINVLLMFFWFRLWMPDDRDLYFNPHLSSLWRLSEQTIGALRAVFLKTPDRLIALLSFLFLLAFRGITFYGLAMRTQNATWQLRLGFEESHLYPGNSGVVAFLTFSVLSFAIFLFTFWGLSLLYAGRQSSLFNHAAETLYHLSRPFSLVRMELRPLVLLIFGLLLAVLLNFDIAVGGGSVLRDSLTVTNLLHYAVSALQGWVKVLGVIQMFMVVLIIGSWASLFATSQELMFFCKDWIDLILGPLRRIPLRLGMLDLTPIVFCFAVGYIGQILTSILAHSYGGLP